jgi:hypothetical protein
VGVRRPTRDRVADLLPALSRGAISVDRRGLAVEIRPAALGQFEAVQLVLI